MTTPAPVLDPLSAFRARIPVYNPSDFPKWIEIAGVSYFFPPGEVGRCICEEHKTDNVGIHDAMDYPRSDRGRLLMDQPRQVVGEGKYHALTCAKYIVNPDQHGKQGFCILSGTPEQQIQQKAEARANWIRIHLETCENIINAWEAACAAQAVNNPGRPAASQKPDVRAAYAFRKKYRSGLVGRLENICNHCGYETNTPEDLAVHVREEHPVAASQARAIAASPSAALPVLPETKPPTSAEELEQKREGKAVLDNAVAANLPLTVADRKGLQYGDMEVVADVRQRLVMAAPGKAAKRQEPEKTEAK